MATICCNSISAQHKIVFSIKNEETKVPLQGVTIHFGKNIKATDNQGMAAFASITAGTHKFIFSYTGFKSISTELKFPLSGDSIEILMQPEEESMEELIVQSTRTSRTIANTPTRIETIDGEELDEKNNMRPANVSMLLHESTGMQVQQTSATTGNASIRMQGLDGRYTQLLKDGYPNFGNFANGLSILEIPPLDLKQVEVIKGPASTLYGAGAIAGVVNFISKTPKEKFEGDFIINQSSIGQTNIGGYVSQKKGKLGFALLAQLNFQKAFDVDKDDFSEIPKSDNFTINPRLFYFVNPSLSIMLGNSFSKGKNTGGDMQVIKGINNPNHVYFEQNKSTRNTTTLEITKSYAGKNSLKLKQSLALFERSIIIPGYSFTGKSTNSFTDFSWLSFHKKHTVVTGMNIISDQFMQQNSNVLDASSTTAGLYLQDTWDISEKLKLESGLRADYVYYRNFNFSKRKTFLLPRISALYRINDKVSTRISGGLGYKIPTIFTEKTESMQYRGINPLNNVTEERSIGGSADINYKTNFSSALMFSINQLFFYTRINKPLMLLAGAGTNVYFGNAAKPTNSAGIETNLKFIYKEDLKLFIGYTYTYAKENYLNTTRFLPLLPKNKINMTLMYEKEDNFKLGLEGYYTDRQFLFDGTRTPAFWEFGFMAQKTFRRVSVFINFENFTDQRQSNYKTVSNGPHENPTFDDIWNHTEGFVVNGGIKLKW